MPQILQMSWAQIRPPDLRQHFTLETFTAASNDASADAA